MIENKNNELNQEINILNSNNEKQKNENEQLKQDYEEKIKSYLKQIEDLNKQKNNVYIPKNNIIKQKENENKEGDNKGNNLYAIKITDPEKELSNQKIKNEELKKDISAFNIEKQEFITQINNLQNELNKYNEKPKVDNDKGDNNDKDDDKNKVIEDKKDNINIEDEDIELIKNENLNLKKEIEGLKANIIDLNQELDAYEKEALESEQEVNILKENNSNLILMREQLMKELEQLKNNTNTNQNKEENKDLTNPINKSNLFTKQLKSFVDKVLFKNKIKLYIDMISMHRMESLIIENTKLNQDKIELSQKVEILTELINNPESIAKYVDENGNINIQYGEDINYDNENINNMGGEEGENNMTNNEQK